MNKDLAYRAAKATLPGRGQLATPEMRADFESALETTLLTDPRIGSVAVRSVEMRGGTLFAAFRAQTDEGPHEGVIPVRDI